ncbi:MAG: anthranilate synthase component I family protein [Methanoregulaceae archaeon]
MVNLTCDEFCAVQRSDDRPLLIPLFAELPLPGISPCDLYAAFGKAPSYILESIEGNEKIARYSCIGFSPVLSVTIGGSLICTGEEQLQTIAGQVGVSDPVQTVREILDGIAVADIPAPKFFGGFTGYFSYDLIRILHPAHFNRARNESEPETPLAEFLLVKDCIVFDHRKEKLYVIASVLFTGNSDPVAEYKKAAEIIRERSRMIQAASQSSSQIESGSDMTRSHDPSKIPSHVSNMTRQEFMDAVNRVKDYISAGETFQTVISRRLECRIRCTPFEIYRALRSINPSPYLYYLDFGDHQVIGASPEMLVRVENRIITTVPIAGTRKRGKTPTEDEALARELLADEKERAEHTMLVDLARNDIGRVAEFGSVHIEGFMSVEKFSHVQHIVSVVEGKLDPKYNAFDAFSACFPAGTVSGAPKIRAMQIIDAIEPSRRGLYAGAVGYIGFDRVLEFAIAIRTLEVSGGTARVQVGAGIVADSVPASEWEETENKCRAMLAAVAAAERSS